MNPHKILKSFTGSQDGIELHSFEEGSEPHLSDDLAAIAVKEGWAEPVCAKSPSSDPEGDLSEESETEESSTDASEEKSLNDAPSNKMKKSAPSNKAK